jgi:signal transduction histidine kinase
VSDLTDQHGHRLGHAVVLRDVTARTTREQRLEVLNRVLRHNLRNDVNAIVGYSDLLADDPDEPEPLADAIVEVADELAAIGEKARRIERLMATAETEADAVSLAPLAQNVLVSAAADAPDVTYERSVPADVVVHGSGYLLEHALRNLVENAIEHNDGDERTVELTASYDPEGTYPLTVSVLDDGPGIPEQDRAAVLDGDETPLEHGSGLGLWVVRWAVTRLGGEIDIVDREGGGTRVDLRLPRASRRTAGPESAPTSAD